MTSFGIQVATAGTAIAGPIRITSFGIQVAVSGGSPPTPPPPASGRRLTVTAFN
jgi:hypothetical protein